MGVTLEPNSFSCPIQGAGIEALRGLGPGSVKGSFLQYHLTVAFCATEGALLCISLATWGLLEEGLSHVCPMVVELSPMKHPPGYVANIVFTSGEDRAV